MKIAVIADTHLRQVTDNFKKQMETHLKGVDMVLHAGDWVGAEILGFLKTYPLTGVYGNMDDSYIKQVLSDKEIITVDGFRLGLTHGQGSSINIEERIKKEFKNVTAIIYGHTHKPSSHWREGILYFNPGSATQNRSLEYNTMGLITLGKSIETQIIRL